MKSVYVALIVVEDEPGAELVGVAKSSDAARDLAGKRLAAITEGPTAVSWKAPNKKGVMVGKAIRPKGHRAATLTVTRTELA